MNKDFFKENYPLIFLILILIFYSPFLFPVGALLVFIDNLYRIINPFVLMPIIVGFISYFVLNGTSKTVYKIIFLIVYGIITIVGLLSVFLVLGSSQKIVFFLIVPHLLITILHSKSAKSIREARRKNFNKNYDEKTNNRHL